MIKKIILISLVMGFLFCGPASAVNLITNGDFETGDFTGWNYTSGAQAPFITYLGGAWGDHTAQLIVPQHAGTCILIQEYNNANAHNISFDIQRCSSGFYPSRVEIYNNDDIVVQLGPESATIYNGHFSIDLTAYTGQGKVLFYANSGTTHTEYLRVDNVVVEDGSPEPTNYITWSTYPEDSWSVGNYSMITVGLPRPPDPVDFYIKTPTTDYIKKPLTKSPLVKTWNTEEAQWYYQYFHTVYHVQSGNYSCKIVNSSANFIEYSDITIPYDSPDIPIPDVITIPTPDPIETPPEWDVTIPESYENVSWMINYTDYWDNLGMNINDTLYSTVGLIFIPLEVMNESVYTVYTHINSAANIVNGFEHTHVIIQVAWDVIPGNIQTIFIGSAAVGVGLFILHRRI